MRDYEKLAESGWRESLRGMIFPSHCDHMGHVNNRWDGHFFDDASMAFWSAVGLSEAGLQSQFGTSAVIAHNSFDYWHELLNGQQFVVMSAFTRVGTKALAMKHVCFKTTQVSCASSTPVSRCFSTSSCAIQVRCLNLCERLWKHS